MSEENSMHAQEALRRKEPHVHCIGATVIAEFNTGLEAVEAYEAYEDTFIVSIGENEMLVHKSDIGVMTESEHMNL